MRSSGQLYNDACCQDRFPIYVKHPRTLNTECQVVKLSNSRRSADPCWQHSIYALCQGSIGAWRTFPMEGWKVARTQEVQQDESYLSIWSLHGLNTSLCDITPSTYHTKSVISHPWHITVPNLAFHIVSRPCRYPRLQTIPCLNKALPGLRLTWSMVYSPRKISF